MAVTPWFMGIGLLLSITAEAGQDTSLNGVAIPRSSKADGGVPINIALLSSAANLAGRVAIQSGSTGLAQDARYTVGSPDDLAAVPDEIDPNPAIKSARIGFPAIDRAAKGDPFVPLRPGFDARLHAPAPSTTSSKLTGPQGWDENANAGSSPRQLAAADRAGLAAATTAPARTFDDGATPGVPLDVALNSSTPTPSDGVLRIIVARPGSELTIAARNTLGGRPNYAALIDRKDWDRQQRCLAEAVYFESRSEPELGQAAVAQVVLNRVKNGDYPANVCGVVYQDRNRPFACQFSFACEGKSLRIEEPGPWTTAVRIARDVTSGALYNPKVGDAVNYHANYVMPYWASTLKRVAQIGNHIFYQVRVGQN